MHTSKSIDKRCLPFFCVFETLNKNFNRKNFVDLKLNSSPLAPVFDRSIVFFLGGGRSNFPLMQDGPLLVIDGVITPYKWSYTWVTCFFHPYKWSYFTLLLTVFGCLPIFYHFLGSKKTWFFPSTSARGWVKQKTTHTETASGKKKNLPSGELT